MKIGLIGCGNIGKFLLETLNINRALPECRIDAVYEGRKKDLSLFSKTYDIEVYEDFTGFMNSGIDLVIEAANIQVVEEYAPTIIENGKDLLIVSVGALGDNSFYKKLNHLCGIHGTKIYLPSGAIGGLDILKAAKSINQLDSVSITTRKPPKSLGEKSLNEEKVIFRGPASEAIKRFPKNINVSIILSLAGLGSQETEVKIIADPKVDKNIHYIEAKGAFGRLEVHVENDPMPENPKTSYLAALSVLSTLKNRREMILLG
ncbi:aspartate dehydrogenase [Pseudalkalibacillus decolorationis]|uniref:aspartate dehydrogenase n=1 Tax=Pseudalkalibacillus decolorationis TaxID=163879 RepID=UPI0021486FC0|nr:aspartate dehydrogenase [Pseudalkalibacillus decolorationis]